MDATLEQDGGRYTVRLERRLAHPPQKVWRVLTERNALKQWFPADVAGGWEVGAKLQFEFPWGEMKGLKPEDMQGVVLAADPPRLLEFRWGQSILRCELASESEGCRLVFSESFVDRSVAARQAAGWEHCLANLLAALDDEPPAAFVWNDWRPVFERYASEWKPMAGPQQGPPEEHPAIGADEGAARSQDEPAQ